MASFADQLLTALGDRHTPNNRLFLDGWATAETSGCRHNPLLTTLRWNASTNCKRLSKRVYVQSYNLEADGVAASKLQLEEQRFAAIRQALRSGNPFTVSDWQLVEGALGTWGAHKWAVEYQKIATKSQAGPPSAGSGPGVPVDALRGWSYMARTLHKEVPNRLYRTATLNRATAKRLLRH